ncbi:DUF4192 family protein [Georgenia sp. Z1491]|uniref:DUF4192 family protein n=1 Tax=Georgenia sp. Z1491 TaxID=3416707 RepID=UPI003CF605CB
MTPMTLRLSCDADLVGAVPHLLGFRPEDSLTLLTTPKVAGGRAVGPAARLDLADAGATDGEPFVAGVVRRLARERLGIYAAVVHTDAPLRDARESPTVLTAVRRVRALDDDRVGAWVVAADGWQRLPGHAPFDDRPGRRSLDDLVEARAVAELVLTGSAPLGVRADLGVVREPGSPNGRLLLDAVAARMRRRAPGIGLSVRAYDELLARRRTTASGALPMKERELLARLLVGLERLEVRDAVLTRVLVGEGLPTELLAEPEIVGPLWMGGPIETADRRLPLEVLARYAPDGAAAPALAMLAMLAWRRGEGPRAAVLADLALADRPGYSLARLVADLQASGTVPPRDVDEWLCDDGPEDGLGWSDLTAFDDDLPGERFLDGDLIDEDLLDERLLGDDLLDEDLLDEPLLDEAELPREDGRG